MITVDEARRITAGTVTEDVAKELLQHVEEKIRCAAIRGQDFVKIADEELTGAERTYLRKKLEESDFLVSEIGITIYW